MRCLLSVLLQGKVDLYPSSIPHVDGSDFWTCRFKVRLTVQHAVTTISAEHAVLLIDDSTR